MGLNNKNLPVILKESWVCELAMLYTPQDSFKMTGRREELA